MKFKFLKHNLTGICLQSEFVPQTSEDEMPFNSLVFCWAFMGHQLTDNNTHTQHTELLSPSQQCHLVLPLRPLREHQGKFEINKLAVRRSLKDSRLTRTLPKHSQLLLATNGGRGCEKKPHGVIVRDSMALSHTHSHTHTSTSRVLLNS